MLETSIRHLASDICFTVAETDHFINAGYGWLCKHCTAEADGARAKEEGARARFFTEGEAEDKTPAMSTPALAKWRDASRQSLVCPRCCVEEAISKA